ncbi:Crp/Fnr family transcriptional regulator [Hymenobacter volaticus]|uniref:Cyclic nucleotide-binding domain-containing protein n=1 Tax=Hymenobacter volaticus TaxID=2932254 RepID=A0ABY4GFF3_9BACT|nr:hypothetical protein [Hymenobacter volaticus]UOQ69587.1 hypothetical protein MUN86_29200 [Hymenobacter volaticus]
MDELFAYLLQFGSLNQRQLDLIASKTTTLTLPKDAYFLEAGQISRQVGFLLEGVLRICYYSNKGDEITRNFVEEHHLVADLRGLEYGLASPSTCGTLAGLLSTVALTSWQADEHVPISTLLQPPSARYWPPIRYAPWWNVWPAKTSTCYPSFPPANRRR